MSSTYRSFLVWFEALRGAQDATHLPARLGQDIAPCVSRPVSGKPLKRGDDVALQLVQERMPSLVVLEPVGIGQPDKCVTEQRERDSRRLCLEEFVAFLHRQPDSFVSRMDLNAARRLVQLPPLTQGDER